jgi:hypothetical protein
LLRVLGKAPNVGNGGGRMGVGVNPSTPVSVYLGVTSALRAVPVLVAVLIVLAGCGAGDGEPATGHAAQHAAGNQDHQGGTHPGGSNPPANAAQPAKQMTVQQLATALGCAPTVTAGADFRQATCTSPTDRYVLVDFDTAEGQRAWLNGGLMYGGIYLIGDRWALSGKPKEYLQFLQGTLGGTIEGDGSH